MKNHSPTARVCLNVPDKSGATPNRKGAVEVQSYICAGKVKHWKYLWNSTKNAHIVLYKYRTRRSMQMKTKEKNKVYRGRRAFQGIRESLPFEP